MLHDRHDHCVEMDDSRALTEAESEEFVPALPQQQRVTVPTKTNHKGVTARARLIFFSSFQKVEAESSKFYSCPDFVP